VTSRELSAEVARMTGFPPRMVEAVLVAQRRVLWQRLVQQEEVQFRGLFRIIPRFRKLEVSLDRQGKREKIERIVLTIRPMKGFREELRKWRSTPS